jgi:hypothetical protein
MEHGLKPAEFWALTPWQFKTYLHGRQRAENKEHNKNVWLFWHSVVWSKMKKIPELKRFMINDGDEAEKQPKKEKKKINEDVIMAWLMGAKALHEQKQRKKQGDDK